jgi:hypothetical protein
MLNGTRSAHSFFEHLDRLFKPTYRPTDQDILRCRQKTTGISETAFHHRGMHYRSVSLSPEVEIRRIDHGAHVARRLQNIRRWRAAERAAQVVGGGRKISRVCVADEGSLVLRVHCFENVTALVFLASLSGYDVRLTALDGLGSC